MHGPDRRPAGRGRRLKIATQWRLHCGHQLTGGPRASGSALRPLRRDRLDRNVRDDCRTPRGDGLSHQRSTAKCRYNTASRPSPAVGVRSNGGPACHRAATECTTAEKLPAVLECHGAHRLFCRPDLHTNLDLIRSVDDRPLPEGGLHGSGHDGHYSRRQRSACRRRRRRSEDQDQPGNRQNGGGHRNNQVTPHRATVP